MRADFDGFFFSRQRILSDWSQFWFGSFSEIMKTTDFLGNFSDKMYADLIFNHLINSIQKLFTEIAKNN